MSELRDFHEFLTERLQSADEQRTPEDLLAEWREEREIVRDVEEALADMAAGDTGVPIADYLRELREKHGLRSPAS